MSPLFALALAASTQAESGCPEGTVLVEEKRIETDTAIYIQPICAAAPSAKPAPPLYAERFTTEADFINAAVALARNERWSRDEVARLRTALDAARDFEPEADSARVQAVWAAIEGRGSDAAVARSAAAAQGPSLLASGWQSGKYADCVLFAIATASGQPYGVVAARANELIKAAVWRSNTYRQDSQAVFSRGGGLNDYEVAILAEAFGQVATIQPPAYAAAVRSGRPIVLPVATASGSGHEIVLARTFRHAGADWFEAIDSTRSTPLYFSAAELGAIALAKGLTVNAEPGKTVPMLRR